MEPNTQRLFQGASGAAGDKLYIEDVFSTYLYTGNGSTQTITNGIDLAGEGGLVWVKARDTSETHILTDTERGAPKALTTAGPAAQFNSDITGFTSTGFTVGNTYGPVNNTNQTQASWTFRKAEKFFDVVTYTGTGSARTISHNLSSVPGFIVVKRTDSSGAWLVYHRSLGATKNLKLNLTDSESTLTEFWNDTAPTSTEFTIGTNVNVNASGGTYVAYLFAHDAGGFGDSGNDSVIKCGTFSGPGFVDLGWEPQWLLIKPYSQTWNWEVYDNMRGMGQPGGASAAQALKPNLSGAEAGASGISFEATGFTQASFGPSYPCIYIAIRRGPMKTPTDATEVFSSLAITTSVQTTGTVRTTNFPVDMMLSTARTITLDKYVSTKLLGGFPNSDVSCPNLRTSSTAAEGSSPSMAYDAWNTTIKDGSFYGVDSIRYFFGRAPGFFDVVAYTGTGSVRTVDHNLGVAPEMMIIKSRSDTKYWMVYTSSMTATDYIVLNLQNGLGTSSTIWNDTEPTSSQFTLGTDPNANGSGQTHVAHLFATCPGVSKVGSYTGTGTTLQIDCGFASGARFVLIKRTDSTGDWYVWDTARGIVSGDDPYLLLNSTAAEVTNTDYIDPYAAGFEISSTAPAAINANGGSFVFLAIA